MIPVFCQSVDNQDWGYNVTLPEVPFPGDEVLCGRWGVMRVVRRTYVFDDTLDEDPNTPDGVLTGAILHVRQERAS